MTGVLEHIHKRAILELDGELYEEYQAYDSLMVEKMWGFPIHDIESIIHHNNAYSAIETLIQKKIIDRQGKTLIGGVRNGNYFLSLMKHGIDTTGIDSNKEMVKHVSVLAQKDCIHYGHMSELPFPDGYFSSAFFHSSLLMNEGTELNKAEVREIHLVLSPAGHLVVEGANGKYWEPIRKKEEDLYEFSSVEEGLWALKKDTSLAKWRNRSGFLWLEFFFITVNSEGLRVNHVYHFVPKQDGIYVARYYHEVVNYEPFEYRIALLNDEQFVNRDHKPLTISDIYEDYQLTKPFNPQSSPGGVIVALRK